MESPDQTYLTRDRDSEVVHSLGAVIKNGSLALVGYEAEAEQAFLGLSLSQSMFQRQLPPYVDDILACSCISLP